MNTYLKQAFGLSIIDSKKLNGYDNVNYLIKAKEGRFI